MLHLCVRFSFAQHHLQAHMRTTVRASMSMHFLTLRRLHVHRLHTNRCFLPPGLLTFSPSRWLQYYLGPSFLYQQGLALFIVESTLSREPLDSTASLAARHRDLRTKPLLIYLLNNTYSPTHPTTRNFGALSRISSVGPLRCTLLPTYVPWANNPLCSSPFGQFDVSLQE